MADKYNIMSEVLTTFVDMDKYLEVLDKYRETREQLQAEQDLKLSAGERFLIAASELEKNKSNLDIINETILMMSTYGNAFAFNYTNNNDIKKN